jgi:hypothetical protein
MIINSTWFWDDTYIERLNMIVINTINMFQTKLRLLSPLLSSIIIHLSQAEVIIIVRWCSCRLAVTGWVSHVEHELLTHPKHMSSPQILSGVRVARSLVFWVLFGRSLFVLLSLFLWPLYCLSFDLRFLVTLVFVLVAIVLSVFWSTVSGYSCLSSCGHCIVCPLIYGFWLLLSMFLWPLYCLSFDLRFLVTLVFLLVAIVLSVCWSTVSGYSCLCSCGHCIVCPLIYGFWLLLSLFLWSLYCLSFDLRFLVILVFVLVAIVLSVLWSTVSGYPFGIFKVFLIEFGHLFKPIWCTWSQSLLNYLAFQSFEYLSVHDEGYCRNVTWELN